MPPTRLPITPPPPPRHTHNSPHPTNTAHPPHRAHHPPRHSHAQTGVPCDLRRPPSPQGGPVGHPPIAGGPQCAAAGHSHCRRSHSNRRCRPTFGSASGLEQSPGVDLEVLFESHRQELQILRSMQVTLKQLGTSIRFLERQLSNPVSSHPIRLATSVCQPRHDRMEQGPTEPHAGRSTFLLSSGGAGGGYY